MDYSVDYSGRNVGMLDLGRSRFYNVQVQMVRGEAAIHLITHQKKKKRKPKSPVYQVCSGEDTV